MNFGKVPVVSLVNHDIVVLVTVLCRIGSHATATQVKEFLLKRRTRRNVAAVSPTAEPMLRGSPKHSTTPKSPLSHVSRRIVAVPDAVQDTPVIHDLRDLENTLVMSPSDVPYMEPSSMNVLGQTYQPQPSPSDAAGLLDNDVNDASHSSCGDYKRSSEREGMRGLFTEIVETFAG